MDEPWRERLAPGGFGPARPDGEAPSVGIRRLTAASGQGHDMSGPTSGPDRFRWCRDGIAWVIGRIRRFVRRHLNGDTT